MGRTDRIMATLSSGPRIPRSRVVLRTRQHVWTPAVKLMGNLLPIGVALPFALFAIGWMIAKGAIGTLGLAFFAFSPVAAWISMNFLGLYRNRQMRRQLEVFLRGVRPKLSSPILFVGAATPKYSSLLDPHEDIGFLILLPDKLEFFGDRMNLAIDRSKVVGVEFRPNVHTVVGLGRWISIDGVADKERIRLLIEPREKSTLLGNLLFGRQVKRKIEAWIKQEGPRT